MPGSFGIDTTKAAALTGVKAVVTAADLPDIPSEEAFVGEGPVNFRDLSRNCMARDKVLYEGHAVAAVAATSASDRRGGARPDRGRLRGPAARDRRRGRRWRRMRRCCTMTCSPRASTPKPAKPSNIAKRVHFALGDRRGRLRRGRGRRRGPLHHPAGASGLYRAACLRRQRRRRRPVRRSGAAARAIHGARVSRQAARHGDRQYPRDAGRDRRRLRRQDHDLPRAGGAGAVAARPAAR